ncbi:MAG: LysE family translocator [Pararhodobacter sp.]
MISLAIGVPLAEFVTVWSILALNIAAPGPNVLNTIAAAIGSGRAAGLASAAGVGFGIGLWCLGMSLGMAAIFAALPLAKQAMTLLAAGLLLWFASRFLAQAQLGFAAGPLAERGMDAGIAEGAAFPARAPATATALRAAFLRSFSINAANPKALTTWLAVLAIFPVARAGPADLALLCAGACALSLGIHAAYALAFSAPPAARAYLRLAPAINLAVALFFALFALMLLASLWPSG